MTWDEFEAWAPRSVRGHAAQQVASGRTEAEALARARQQLEAQLPDGIASYLQLLHTVRADAPGRPTEGHLWLRVRPRASEVEAYVMDVEISPEARGQGYGRATMLAAEDLASDLGATVLRLNVFGHNTVARALYASLGLRVQGATMTTTAIPHAGRMVDAPGAGLGLEPLTAPAFHAFQERWLDARAAERAASEALSSREALRRAADDLRRALPRGPDTPGQLLRAAYDGTELVGTLWLELAERSGGVHAVMKELWVAPGPRRLEHARAVLVAALSACRALEVSSLEVTVPGADGANEPGVYEQLGFEITAQTLAKPLPGSPARR